MKQSDFAEFFPGKIVPIKNGEISFVPDPPPQSLRVDQELRITDEKANRAIGRLQAIIPSLPNPALITTPFMRREAVLSSKIEGTRTELAGLFLFEEMHCGDDSVPQNDDELDAQEVHNYVVAQTEGFRMLKEMPLCMRIVRTMHEKLMHGIPGSKGFDKRPGQYRKTQAFIGPDGYIGNARYVAPMATEVDRLMDELEKFIHSPNELPSLMAIGIIHYQFEAIHPFFDGNGRLGRLLIALLLAAKDILSEPILYLSAFFERRKQEYIRLLFRISTHVEWREWILFFLEGIIVVAYCAGCLAKNLLQLREQHRAKFQSNRATTAKTLELIDGLFRWPVTSVNRAMNYLEMSHQGATKYIQNLQQSGVLEEVTGNRRNRLFIAKEIVEMIS